MASTLTIRADEVLYTVIDGTRVHTGTFAGYKAWQSSRCGRCHGANQDGLVGLSLIERLRVLSKTEFIKTLTEERLTAGMPSFGANNAVIDNLYAYLKGRSDRKITAVAVEEIH